MKFPTLPSILALLSAFAAPTQAQTPPTRIVPLGDSITFGSSVAGGYRKKLYDLLTTAGYNVDYVGVQTGNPVASLPDSDHQGIGGWKIDQVVADLPKWIGVVNDPDVVLLHIGTNDFGGAGTDTINAINRLDVLITKLATQLPYAHIIVTNLMERGVLANAPNTTIEAEFNPFVQARVDAHVALGRRVTFLNMRSFVPVAEMPDALHPGQIGYDHMADAWAPAVQAVISPLGDALPPGLARAKANPDRTHVNITFSKPVADSAATVGNFALSGGLTVSAVTLDATKRIATLTTSQQTLGTQYTATVNNVMDRLAVPNALPANSTISFFAATPRGYLNNVPESAGYTLAYSLDIPTTVNYKAALPAYSANNSAQIGPISRVAYYMELQTPTGDLQYLWASMAPFTTDVSKIGVPTLLSTAQFQTNVTDLTVVSNSPNVTTGTGLTGNVEFWPINYQAANSANVPGASISLFDFGDQPSAGNYGSMQLHNFAAGQTLFSFSNWGGNASAGDVCLGIGNNPAPTTGGVDWTFANNGAAYTIRTLQVLVQTDGDLTPPTMLTARGNFSLNKITLTMSEPVLASSILAGNFTLSDGVVVLSATIGTSPREIILTTTAQPPSTPLTLTVSGLRDTSCNANRIAPSSTIVVSPPALPAAVTTNIGAAATGYQTVYSIDLPTTGNLNALGAAAYSLDERFAPGGFDRVAYYLELTSAAGATQYAWASMDTWTASKGKIGIPLLSTGAMFQQNVTNLEVVSNVAGVVNGTTAAGGNIEIWPNSYSAANGLAVPNASAANYDFGDTVTGATPTAGYGCLQIHNHDVGAAQTVLAVNRFGTDGQILDVGIGNNTATPANLDWTFAANAGNFIKRTLHVMVRPSANYLTPSAVTTNVGSNANGYQLAYSIDLPGQGSTPNLIYSTNNSADIAGFSRVAYYLELLPTGSSTPNWIWTSMDAFTNDAKKVGIPTVAAGATFQQNVTNLDVVSNVAGIVQGTTVSGGNIEFWPNNYSGTNALGIPNASTSTTLLDFGDTMSGTAPASGHGSMQVHNHDTAAKQTLFAFNNWGTTAVATNVFALGIGNDPNTGRASYHPDWTFAANAVSAYATTPGSRRMHIFVLPTSSDSVGPTVTRVTASSTLNRCNVTFSEAVSEGSANPANFALNGGVSVLGATLVSSTEISLTTSAQTPNTAYTVTVSNIRDRSPAGNVSLVGASGTFTSYNPPALLGSISEATGFSLLYALPMPNTALFDRNAVPYTIDESKYPQFTSYGRVAYLMELAGASPALTAWVWVSCDPFTTDVKKLGVPTAASGAVFQQNISNMTVIASSGAPVVTGTGLAGNIEFWPTNYSAPNALGVPNAAVTDYDWGDTRSTTGNYGSLQIHNPSASQTLLAYNGWGGVGVNSSIGIGNDPLPVANGTNPVTYGVDWTFHVNAPTYTTKNLYVFGRPGGTAIGTAPVILSQPCPRAVSPGANTSFLVTLTTAGPFAYQWRYNGSPLSGQTSAWLDLTNIVLAQDGNYDCVVTGAGAVQTLSNPARLTVLETEPPVIGSCPDISIFTTDPAGAAVMFPSPTATDNSPTPPVVTCVPASGSIFPLGTTAVTCTARDGSGNTATCTFNVIVGFHSSQNSSIAVLPNGHISLVFRGTTGQSYKVQRSTDLVTDWTDLATVIAGPDGTIPAEDPAPPAQRAFYRVVP
jgi:lysophospholipase L1-like esterase